LLFTVVPAAFVTAVPIELVDGFSASGAGALLGSALVFLALGYATCALGLRRCISGAPWTRA
jgi:hypothetical protein